MTKILIASRNQGKLEELQSLMCDLDIELILPKHIGLDLDVIEDGNSYMENASKKAKTYAEASGLISLADDTGLEVNVLDEKPGIYSARFAPQPEATDADRREYLLEMLRPHPRPWAAQFRCVVALYDLYGNIHYSEGICPGEIIPDERGQYGFGYDPIFLVQSMGRTMAELTMEEKNHLSHRALAIHAIQPLLLDMINSL